MGMTMCEKILAAHAGRDSVAAGELLYCGVDIVMGNDITAPVAIGRFRERGLKRVFDRNKVVIVLDHFAPNKDVASAEQCKISREFAEEQGLRHFYDVGQMGIEHALLPEKGIVGAGQLVVGADSHTCTYGALGALSTGVGSTDMAYAMATGRLWFKAPKSILFRLHGKLKNGVSGKDLILHIIGTIGVDGALYRSMEFTGAESLTMDDRFTVSNMAIEAGGKCGIFMSDQKTREYVERSGGAWAEVAPDSDAEYERIIDIDLSGIEYTVAKPHLPGNTEIVKEMPIVKIDQAVIGSCTNGRLSDIKAAADILRGKKVAKGVRAIVIPATQNIYLEALEAGYITDLVEAGCAVSTPTCGPCLGGHMGILGSGETAVSTTNRNFVGRMGAKDSRVYLASPAVAAASAIAGYIVTPDEI